MGKGWKERHTQKRAGEAVLIAYKIEFKAKNRTSWRRHKIQRRLLAEPLLFLISSILEESHNERRDAGEKRTCQFHGKAGADSFPFLSFSPMNC